MARVGVPCACLRRLNVAGGSRLRPLPDSSAACASLCCPAVLVGADQAPCLRLVQAAPRYRQT